MDSDMSYYYLESDNDTDCWNASCGLFMDNMPELNKWYTVKELKEQFGFNPWLGKPPQAGRYKLVGYG